MVFDICWGSRPKDRFFPWKSENCCSNKQQRVKPGRQVFFLSTTDILLKGQNVAQSEAWHHIQLAYFILQYNVSIMKSSNAILSAHWAQYCYYLLILVPMESFLTHKNIYGFHSQRVLQHWNLIWTPPQLPETWTKLLCRFLGLGLFCFF